MLEDICRFGFGFMRLPQKNLEIDYETLQQMVDLYIKSGGNYFDTAYTYYDGISEEAIRKTVIERYPRDKIRLANKMPIYDMTKDDNPEEIFEDQLRRCGVDYFDYYLLHGLEEEDYEVTCKELNIFDLLQEYKKEGKIKKIGFSFHDMPEVLDKILTEHPEMEFVQLQINYLDWYNPEVESKKCYDVACKHNKPIMIMEPLLGGRLAKVPKEVQEVFDEANMNPATLALSYVFSLDNVAMILSGMNNIGVMKENLEFLKKFNKINEDEKKLIEKARAMLEDIKIINCTNCNYCRSGCPQKIPISSFFKLYNRTIIEKGPSKEHINKYNEIAQKHTKASDCIACERCEEVCPQHLEIVDNLDMISELFE